MTDHLPTRVGPCEFGQLGNWITVRCPRELAPLMRQAGGHSPGQIGPCAFGTLGRLVTVHDACPTRSGDEWGEDHPQ